MADFRVTSGDLAQWDAVIHALGDANDSIPKDVAKALQDVARKIADIQRAAVLAEPTHGAKHRGLRAAIADGVYVNDTFDGAEINADLYGWPGANSEHLPADMDDGGWEHPVFGHDVWVDQSPYSSWFSGPLDAAEPLASQAVEDAFDQNIAKVESA